MWAKTLKHVAELANLTNAPTSGMPANQQMAKSKIDV